MTDQTHSTTVPSAVPTITGNPMYDSLVRSVLLALSAGITAWIVTWLTAHKIVDPNLNVLIGGAVLTTLSTIAMVVWGMIAGSRVNQVIAVKQTQAVQAGINMTVSGAALGHDGKTIVSVNDGSTPPLPVTPETAKEIVKNFGPDEHAITEALNASQLKGTNS